MEGEFGLVRSFMIDDGEIDQFSPQECFVLGYELATLDARIDKGDPFRVMMHAENCDRVLSKLNEKPDANFRFVWPKDDRSESWVELVFGGTKQ